MATNTPLLDLIKAEIGRQFNEQAAIQLFDLVEENGFDDESIWEDVRDEQESMLKDQIPSIQFRCIKRVCTKYHKSKSSPPHSTSHKTQKHQDITNLKRNYTNWNKKTQQTRKLFLSQCPGLLNNFPEKAFIDAVTLGRDNNLPLILYIADTFSRYRINTFCDTNYQKEVSTHDFRKTLPFYQSMEKSNSKGTAIHAILSSYHSRFVPKLEFDPKNKINDNIEDIVRYIFAAAQMIDSLLMERKHKISIDPHDDVIPFQFDLLIIPKHSNSNANINDEYDAVLTVDSDEDIDDSDETDEDEPEESYDIAINKKNRDQIGLIEPRLRKYDIKSVSFDIEERLLKQNASAHIKRKFNEKFREIRKGRNGRYVMIVDRRNKEDIHDITHNDDIKREESDGKKTNNDKIYIYSPSCQVDDDEKNTANTFDKIHLDYMDESLLFNTKKCCIPGVNEAMDTHLGADCTDIITLSFHVLSVDVIRCYLYINGWGSRFQPIDLIKLLPIYFEKKAPSKSNILNEDKLNTLFPLKLKDEKFDSWYAETTKKKRRKKYHNE